MEAPTPEQDAWMRAVLGVGTSERRPSVWTRAVGGAIARDVPSKAGASGLPKDWQQDGPGRLYRGAGGKPVTVAHATDGRVALTREPPPITEITFSGGGGKGAALPGALRALKQGGALDSAKCIHGASVGSMTAAMVAAGVTPEAFQQLSDDTDWDAVIKGGKAVKYHLGGERLEELVRNAMRSSVAKQISAFAAKVKAGTAKLDRQASETLDTVNAHLAKGGPTFMDLRLLSKIIPEIKEVVISGTLIGRSGKPAPGEKPGAVAKTAPEPVVFSADTQPSMEVARAVHASAALPPVFKPVELTLEGGEVGRFEDGGALNNAPTPGSIGEDPDIDPVPATGTLTFVFEDDDSVALLAGEATPSRSRLGDRATEAEFSAATYGKNRGLADRPEDVVMVPLRYMTAAGDDKDFSGIRKGTTNFAIPEADRRDMQVMSEQATRRHLEERKEPETRTFESPEQMLACAAREELATLAGAGYPGAKAALAFRDGTDRQVTALEGLAAKGAAAGDKRVRKVLEAMDQAAAGDQERIGYAGRALNRSKGLGALLAGAKGVKAPDLDTLAAGIAVAEVLAARKAAQAILRQLVRPKVVRESPKGPAGALLAQLDTMLRDARSASDVNGALRIGAAYFGALLDPGGHLGHRAFAAALSGALLPADTL